MKSYRRGFFISLIAFVGLITCNCNRYLEDNSRSFNTQAAHDEEQREPEITPPRSDQSTISEKTATLTVKGIVCQSCKNGLETLLRKQEGVSSVAVSLESENNNVVVVYRPQKITLEKIIELINETWEVVPMR